MPAESVCITRGDLSALMSTTTAQKHLSCSKLAANSALAPAFNSFLTRLPAPAPARGGGLAGGGSRRHAGTRPSPELEGPQQKEKVTGGEQVSDPIASAGLKISLSATVNISPSSALRGVNRRERAIKAMLRVRVDGWTDGGMGRWTGSCWGAGGSRGWTRVKGTGEAGTRVWGPGRQGRRASRWPGRGHTGGWQPEGVRNDSVSP